MRWGGAIFVHDISAGGPQGPAPRDPAARGAGGLQHFRAEAVAFGWGDQEIKGPGEGAAVARVDLGRGLADGARTGSMARPDRPGRRRGLRGFVENLDTTLERRDEARVAVRDETNHEAGETRVAARKRKSGDSKGERPTRPPEDGVEGFDSTRRQRMGRGESNPAAIHYVQVGARADGPAVNFT